MKYYIDRFEGAVAVCEDENGGIVRISPVPDGAREGSVIVIGEDGEYTLDLAEEESRREKLFGLQNSLFDC